MGNSGGDPATTDAGSADPADMNSPRLALHYNNDAADPGWEDLTECGLLLSGWDGNTNIVDETAYIIHNKGRFLRLIDHPASNSVSHATVLNRTATEQFRVQTAQNGKKYIVGLSDGRRLSCDGSSVGLAASGTTGTAVEWEFNEYQHGWFYIDHPSTGKRLRITDANVIDVTSDADTYDNVRFRFIKHYLPITVAEVQVLPYVESFEDGIGDWREFDNASARFWEVGTGGTPSGAAGPGGASDGNYYLFSEGHDAGSYVTNVVECTFDFSTVPDVELIFDYHMYGSYIALLSLDVFDGTSWLNDVWKKSGPQHTGSDQAWSTAVVDLTSYAGNSAVTLRFRTANTQYNSADPAIDHIRIADSDYNYAPVAHAQRITTPMDSAVAITLSGSDTDGDSLSYSFEQPANGSLTGMAPNLIYTSPNGYVGPDSFTFAVNDGVLDSADASVSITVDPAEDPGQVIFEATTANTTLFSNEPYGGGTTAGNIHLTGAAPDLLLANDGPNFFAGGFAGTESINMLNGTALTELNSVTISVTVDSITHTGTSELRSRGFEFGMASDAAFNGGTGDNLILHLGGGGNSGNVAMVDSFATFSQAAFTIDPGSMADGFGVTLTADEAGFTFSFTDVTASSGTLTDLTGTFATGEFAHYFGTGHFYASVQKRYAGTTALDISEVSLSVKGGQGDAPEFTAGGTYISGGNLVMGFTGSVGYEYSIESTDDLTNPNSWTVVTNIYPLLESPMEVALPITNPAAFYRVGAE